jgi:GNAT superfamily N-acetyltransferase
LFRSIEIHPQILQLWRDVAARSMDETGADVMETPVATEIGLAGPDDIPHWMSLAEEVRSLFGPMSGFDTILMRKITKGQAYCARARGQGLPFVGGVLIGGAGQVHWIRWLAVCANHRRLGIGRLLVEAVICSTPEQSVLFVDTFPSGTPGALQAELLYQRCGFIPVALVNVDGQLRQRYRRHRSPQHAPSETPPPPHCR